MNNKIEYWKWKSTIIDFNNISDEKADFGDYWTKKEMVFHYLGTPDDGIHEWYNGGWSCEYNHALSYAKELGLVETYIDYDDELYNKDKEIERLNNIIDDKKERQEIAIRLLHKLFGTDDYEINYIIGIINGQRQIKFDEELKEGKNGRL